MRTWKKDLEAVNGDAEHRRKVRDLTADLPTNARVVVSVAEDPNPALRGQTVTVVRSLRDDPLVGMLSRSQIDQAQFMAGRKWQEYAEMSEIGGVQAIDTTKEPVDGGGGFREPISDKQIEAFKALMEINKRLGPELARLVLEVLGWRVGIRQAAESRGRFTKWGWEKTGKEFRGALDVMAKLLGYSNGERAETA